MKAEEQADAQSEGQGHDEQHSHLLFLPHEVEEHTHEGREGGEGMRRQEFLALLVLVVILLSLGFFLFHLLSLIRVVLLLTKPTPIPEDGNGFSILSLLLKASVRMLLLIFF